MNTKDIQCHSFTNHASVGMQGRNVFYAFDVQVPSCALAEVLTQRSAGTLPVNGGHQFSSSENGHRPENPGSSSSAVSDVLGSLSASDIVFLSGSSSAAFPDARVSMIMDRLFGTGRWALSDWRRMAAMAGLALVINGGVHINAWGQFTANVCADPAYPCTTAYV